MLDLVLQLSLPNFAHLYQLQFIHIKWMHCVAFLLLLWPLYGSSPGCSSKLPALKTELQLFLQLLISTFTVLTAAVNTLGILRLLSPLLLPSAWCCTLILDVEELDTYWFDIPFILTLLVGLFELSHVSSAYVAHCTTLTYASWCCIILSVERVHRTCMVSTVFDFTSSALISHQYVYFLCTSLYGCMIHCI